MTNGNSVSMRRRASAAWEEQIRFVLEVNADDGGPGIRTATPTERTLWDNQVDSMWGLGPTACPACGGFDAAVAFGQEPVGLGGNGVSTQGGGTCRVEAVAPPPADRRWPWNSEQEFAEWLAWWGQCVPNTAIGPGIASGCGNEEAWQSALTWCTLSCIMFETDPDRRCLDFNFVSYAWVDEDCVVRDAECNVVSDFDVRTRFTVSLWYTAWSLLVGTSAETGPDDAAAAPAPGATGAGGELSLPWMDNNGAASTGATGQTAGSEPPSDLFDFEDLEDYAEYYNGLAPSDQSAYDGHYESAATWLDEDPAHLDRILEGCVSGETQRNYNENGMDGTMLCIAAGQVEAEGGLFDPHGSDDPCAFMLC